MLQVLVRTTASALCLYMYGVLLVSNKQHACITLLISTTPPPHPAPPHCRELPNKYPASSGLPSAPFFLVFCKRLSLVSYPIDKPDLIVLPKLGQQPRPSSPARSLTVSLGLPNTLFAIHRQHGLRRISSSRKNIRFVLNFRPLPNLQHCREYRRLKKTRNDGYRSHHADSARRTRAAAHLHAPTPFSQPLTILPNPILYQHLPPQHLDIDRQQRVDAIIPKAYGP